MQDGVVRRTLKAVALARFRIDLTFHRATHRAPSLALGGACTGSGMCCERPTVQVGVILWYIPTPRRLFLWWQEKVNGFTLVEKDRTSRAFVFQCSHFDAETRRCDSYRSRPGMCRDYPRLLMDQPSPELFPECGYKIVARESARLKSLLEQQDIDPAKRQELYEKLHLSDDDA